MDKDGFRSSNTKRNFLYKVENLQETIMPEAAKECWYSRLGGYDSIAAVVDNFLPRLREDPRLRRFWTSPRSIDTNNRERQLAVDFIAAAAGGPVFYLGRDMKTSDKGMGIDREDYGAFKKHLAATLAKFNVLDRECSEVMAFIAGLEDDIVEN